jgi:Spy/CpxP family protein refolding chaperone
MTKLLRWTATLSGAMLLALALPAFAQPGPGPHGGPGGHGPGPGMVARMAEELDLSDAQKTQLQSIFDKYHSGDFGATMQSFHDARKQLEALIRDPAATDQQVLDASRQAAAQGEKMAIQRHRMAIEIDGILTPEQRDKAKQLKAQGWGRPGHFQPPPEDPGDGE